MEASGLKPVDGHLAILNQIQNTLRSLQQDYRSLHATVEAIEGRINLNATIQKANEAADRDETTDSPRPIPINRLPQELSQSSTPIPSSPSISAVDGHQNTASGRKLSLIARNSNPSSRIILTTYPGQSGIDPVIMNWGHSEPKERGPVVVSRSPSTVRRRNGMSLSRPNEFNNITCFKIFAVESDSPSTFFILICTTMLSIRQSRHAFWTLENVYAFLK